MTPQSEHGKNNWGDEIASPIPVKKPARRRRFKWRRLFIVLACVSLFAAGALWRRIPGDEPPPGWVLPGEFERQEALLFAWDDEMSSTQRQSVIAMVSLCWRNIDVLMLVPDQQRGVEAWRQLDLLGVPKGAIRIEQYPMASPWVRDFGPIIRKSFATGCDVLDVEYAPPPRGRSRDLPPALKNCEDLPMFLASKMAMQHRRAEMVLPGGNLLSNGAGMYLTTDQLLVANRGAFGHTRSTVASLLRQHVGGDQVVFLKNLKGELTGHIDMFAAFLATDLVVVGEYDPRYDPVNAKILDENAARLRNLRTAAGPLRVERVPMPPRHEGHWWTYTNIVLANGVAIVPSYDGVDAEIENEAIETYRRLLRGWEIETVDATSFLEDDGGPRCATMHLFQIGPHGDS